MFAYFYIESSLAPKIVFSFEQQVLVFLTPNVFKSRRWDLWAEYYSKTDQKKKSTLTELYVHTCTSHVPTNEFHFRETTTTTTNSVTGNYVQIYTLWHPCGINYSVYHPQVRTERENIIIILRNKYIVYFYNFYVYVPSYKCHIVRTLAEHHHTRFT